MNEPLPPIEHEFATLRTSRDPVYLALRTLQTLSLIVMAICLIVIAADIT